MMSRKRWICLVAVLAMAGIAAVVLSVRHPKAVEGLDPAGNGLPRPVRVAQPSVPARAERRPASKPRPKPVLNLVEDDDDNRTPAVRTLAARIEKALDDEDLEAALACADEALKCGDVEVRQNMVDALGWFGEKAIPELTPFLADSDEDVRDSAMNEWTMALSSIEDEGGRIRIVELAMGVLKDEDVLEEISNEYVGVDEKLAVESLSRIIEGGGSAEGVDKAKETYEFVTGEEWTDVESAARWIAEEYSPPEEVP